ncbi:MAG TPA: endonuclease NucS [Thermoanaerobaculaceae bacterium]|nr:endonuclease NucS [Thermoanaerobaculaceae bacterium]HPS77941.1 endonuclease NucS [Thermoanaerobaculaceae bacterium]
MGQQGVWEISEDGPRRLSSSTVELEKHLEEWIERDPSLVQGGLTIVARQVQTEAGPLDLLALDPQGRWVVIEVKRGVLRRDTVAQALDYASAIAGMTLGDLEQIVDGYLRSKNANVTLQALLRQRQLVLDRAELIGEAAIIVVGTGKDRGLDRMVKYLASPGTVAITAVMFEVFEPAGGKRVLVRELSEDDHPPTPDTQNGRDALDALVARAQAAGTGAEIAAFLRAAQSLGLYPHPWKASLMLAPPANKTRCLLTVWTEPNTDGDLTLYVAADAFAEFYRLDRDTVVKELLGADKWFALPRKKVKALTEGLGRLLAPAAEDA